uniref:Prefoldin subunit 5 n=1 Tax=Heterorhabditis bacteriophora TaxID=37862 RepID=A0A1I7W6D7_HETBA
MSLLNHDFDEKRISTLQKAAKQIRDCFQEIERMDSIIFEKRRELKEYDALMKRLTDLPKKLQHHAMVPFGSAGFMPGKIVRTNEVMMLVGDGYFVEKSCHEANEALLRRTKAIEKIIDDCEADKKLVKQQMDFAERLFSHVRFFLKFSHVFTQCNFIFQKHNSDEVEIREEFDEEKEAEFKRETLNNNNF